MVGSGARPGAVEHEAMEVVRFAHVGYQVGHRGLARALGFPRYLPNGTMFDLERGVPVVDIPCLLLCTSVVVVGIGVRMLRRR